jgi:hypothetical protein
VAMSEHAPITSSADEALDHDQAHESFVQSDPSLAEGSESSAQNSQASGEQRTFSAILEGLRTAEDTFYFVVEEGPDRGRRIPVETAGLIIGWDEPVENLSTDPATIAVPCAVIRKDWTGVMLQPEKNDAVLLGGQMLTGPQRLRNGDQLTLLSPETADGQRKSAVLVFHEPASLVVLDSLLPNKLPRPITKALGSPSAESGDREKHIDQVPSTGSPAKTYFGYFSLFELLLLCAGTLALAAIVFLILDNT